MSKVYLVGAGPGDPDLITIKGRSVLETADCVLYDHLANEALLEYAPAGAERIYVGKKRTERAYQQDEICRMMIERSRKGLSVVRLKGGDPFVFGRGGEELEALAEAGVPFEVIPGVTSPLGIAAYTGVPLTHRKYNRVLTFVTGHDVDAIDWSREGQAETLVIFMGLSNIGAIMGQIVSHGRSPDTPAAAVRWGTRADQQTLVGTLETLPRLVEQHEMKPPATIIIGEVVALREQFNWFEKLPLFGRRIIITRAREQATDLSRRLRALGAEAIELAVIEIQPAPDYSALDAAIARLPEYDWLIFTSVNGVRFFLERLDRSSVDLRSLRARICTIGPATRRAVEALHLTVDLCPEEYVAESLITALSQYDLKGKRILLPRAAVARDVVPVELSRLGAQIDVVEAYRTVIPEDAAARARHIFSSGHKPDWITFTSSSTVRNFISVAGGDALEGVHAASIGPVTSATLREYRIEPAAEARPYTTTALIEAIVQRETGASSPCFESI